MSQRKRLTTDDYHSYDERIADENDMDRYPCPCKDCLGGKVRKINVIYRHMIRHGHSGIIPWDNNYYEDMIEVHSMRDEEVPNIPEVAPNIDEEATMLDEGVEVNRMLNEGLNDDWAKSMEDALKPVYANCKLSHLTTILQILNLQVVHGWTNESVDELLAFLSQLLPRDSTLPTK
jgi:hypothetical protein